MEIFENITEGFSVKDWKNPILQKFILQDSIRNKVFHKALKETVKKGDTILDLGSGSGFLAILAVKLGAKKVYAIEVHSKNINLARQIASDNQVDDKIDFIKGNSLKLNKEIIPPVDIIVSEILGFMGVGENIVEYISDAKNKWLKKNGKIIPEEIKLYLAPVFNQKYQKQSNFFNNSIEGINLSRINQMKENQIMRSVNPKFFLGDPVEFSKINLYFENEVKINKEIKFQINKTGTINGFVGWFKARLSKNSILNTSPYSNLTCWYQMFYPTKIKKVKERDKVVVKVVSDKSQEKNLVLLKINF